MAKVDFGFEEVPEAEKAQKVGRVFDRVAERYDVMNDLMSLGLHRAWKRFTLWVSGVRRGERVLDVAAGSGDLRLEPLHGRRLIGVIVLVVERQIVDTQLSEREVCRTELLQRPRESPITPRPAL